MRKTYAKLMITVLCMAAIACSQPSETGSSIVTFKNAPALRLVPVSGGFVCTWQDASPAADRIDLHYSVSDAPINNPDIIWQYGLTRRNVQLFDAITVILDDGEFFSAFITANKDRYAIAYSNVEVKSAEDMITEFEFDVSHVLTIIPGEESLVCSWTSAYPFPNRYDLYYAQGNFTSAAQVKANGNRIKGCAPPYTIESLDSGKIYSVAVTALRAGYVSTDSAVISNLKPLSK